MMVCQTSQALLWQVFFSPPSVTDTRTRFSSLLSNKKTKENKKKEGLPAGLTVGAQRRSPGSVSPAGWVHPGFVTGLFGAMENMAGQRGAAARAGAKERSRPPKRAKPAMKTRQTPARAGCPQAVEPGGAGRGQSCPQPQPSPWRGAASGWPLQPHEKGLAPAACPLGMCHWTCGNTRPHVDI